MVFLKKDLYKCVYKPRYPNTNYYFMYTIRFKDHLEEFYCMMNSLKLSYKIVKTTKSYHIDFTKIPRWFKWALCCGGMDMLSFRSPITIDEMHLMFFNNFFDTGAYLNRRMYYFQQFLYDELFFNTLGANLYNKILIKKYLTYYYYHNFCERNDFYRDAGTSYDFLEERSYFSFFYPINLDGFRFLLNKNFNNSNFKYNLMPYYDYDLHNYCGRISNMFTYKRFYNWRYFKRSHLKYYEIAKSFVNYMHVHINETRSNIFIALTNESNHVIRSYSCGFVKDCPNKRSKKENNVVDYLGRYVGQELFATFKMRNIKIFLNGSRSYKNFYNLRLLFFGMKSMKLYIRKYYNLTKKSHNGIKKRKKKRK